MIVLVSWTLFRAPTFHAALLYLKDLAGAGHPDRNELLISGILYQKYNILVMIAAAITVGCLPDTWEFTQRLTFPKAGVCVALFWVALVMLASQTYNPFIYFRF